MNDLNVMVAREALKKMFQDSSSFYISDFDKIMEVLGVMVPKETRDRLALLHCISWNAMEPETRAYVAQTVDSLLTDPALLKRNFLPRVLGGGKVYAISEAIRHEY